MADGSLIAGIGGVIALYLGLSVTMFLEVTIAFLSNLFLKMEILVKKSKPLLGICLWEKT